MAFYDDMAAMAFEVLGPEALGQTGIVLVRETRQPPDPAAPWLGSVVEVERETLRAAAKGADKLADGVTILSTDLVIIAAVPDTSWQLGPNVTLRVEVNGVQYTVVAVNTKPRAGTPVAVEFIARDGRVNESDQTI